jgi:hypothetical protein
LTAVVRLAPFLFPARCIWFESPKRTLPQKQRGYPPSVRKIRTIAIVKSSQKGTLPINIIYDKGNHPSMFRFTGSQNRSNNPRWVVEAISLNGCKSGSFSVILGEADVTI